MYEYKGKKMKTKTRNVYMDILKIISMFMVILLHATNFGIQDIKIEIGSINYFIVWNIRIFSMVAVNCFVLISGYFLCQKKENKENILKKDYTIMDTDGNVFNRSIFVFMFYSTKWSEIFDKDMHKARFANSNI